MDHDPIVARFALVLRRRRIERGLTQAQLAEQAQVTTNYISRLERCEGGAPGIDLVARLAVALAVPISTLLPEGLDDGATNEDHREYARQQFEALIKTEDRTVLIALAMMLTRLNEEAQ